jgi:predicted dehydrogenase
MSTAKINQAILNGASQTDRAVIVAVASRDRRRGEEYAREHNIARVHTGYESLLDDRDVEAVYISLPNSLHVEWSVRALQAGKHVLCEKPLGRRPAEVERAFDVADRAGLVLMEAFMYRHHPQTHALAEVVRSGRIGTPRLVLSRFSFALDDPVNVRLRPELDGGALMDVGCYCISAARLIAGEPELVLGRQVVGATGVDVRFLGVLHFAGDVLSGFVCGFDVPFLSRVEVVGSEGYALVPDPWLCRDPHVEVNGQRIDIEDVDRYRLELENFAGAVRGEAEPLLGRADAIGQARTIAALYRSAASGSAEAP